MQSLARNLVHLLLMLLTVMSMAGCASTPARSDSRTGGVELSLYKRDHTGAEVFYTLDQDGTLGFGGGLKARLNSTTWQGAMSDDEIAQVRALLQEHDWFRTQPRSSDEPTEQLYRVKLCSAEGRRSFTVKGTSEALDQLEHLLAAAASRRLDADLQRLPLPSSQR